MAMSFDPFNDLDRLVGALPQFRQGPRYMPVDLYREADQYVLVADLPGIDPGSVDVDVDGQLLSIRAQRTVGGRDGAKWIAQERPHGTYLRQFSVGEGIDTEHISATYDNGVLTVIAPVSPKSKPRKIAVESAQLAEQKAVSA
jgi:HSP20 family protein